VQQLERPAHGTPALIQLFDDGTAVGVDVQPGGGRIVEAHPQQRQAARQMAV